MQTNLLGRMVTVEDSCKYDGEIVAIYPDGNDIIKFGILDTNGNFHFGIAPQYANVRKSKVWLHYRLANQKIQAIKLVRDYMGLTLAESKDLVEGSVNQILLGEFSLEKVQDILRDAAHYEMECTVE